MKKMKKTVAILLAILLIAVPLLSAPASALTYQCDVETFSDSLLMVNLDTGISVYEKNAEEKRYPASLVKIMTYIVVVENVDDIDNTKIEIKESVIDDVIAEGMNTSGLDWHAGERLSVTDVLYAMMVPLGHDAAMVLADYVSGGDIKAFVELMNKKAEDLGCQNTHFTNPTGVHDPDQYTTAADLAVITRYAMGLPMFSKIVSTATYYIEDDDYPLITTNYMIDEGRGGDYFYLYATGVKNGTTVEAGRCLVATAVYEGYAYLVVSLHAPYDEDKDMTDQYCMIEAANLFRWAFLNLSFITVVTKDTPVCEQPVDHAWDTESILLLPDADLNVVLPYDYNDADITIVPDKTESVSAPIEAGEFITTATVCYKGEPFTSINLIAHDSVSVSPILYTTDAIRAVLTSPWFLIAVAVIVVLFIIYVSVSSTYAKKKRSEKKKRYK